MGREHGTADGEIVSAGLRLGSGERKDKANGTAMADHEPVPFGWAQPGILHGPRSLRDPELRTLVSPHRHRITIHYPDHLP